MRGQNRGTSVGTAFGLEPGHRDGLKRCGSSGGEDELVRSGDLRWRSRGDGITGLGEPDRADGLVASL